jgi:hypothetical protein
VEEFGGVIAVVIGILWYVLPLVLRARARSQQQTAAPPPAPTIDFQMIAQAIDHGRKLIGALADKTKTLKNRVKTALGPAKILDEVLDQLSLEQDVAREALEASALGVEVGQFPSELPQILGELEWQGFRLGAVEHMIDIRSNRVSGEMMADADAIAAAHLKPIVSFCQRRDIAFPHRHPLCIPAVPGQEAVFFGLLPDGYPTVFVPSDFGDDLLRWPAVSHEVGHVIWRELPGFAAELRQVNGLRVDPTVPTSPRDFKIRKAYAAWLEELFCDFFAVLQLGPPALRGMIHLFSGTPVGHLVWATATQDGTHYEEHPPPHLRVTLAAHALWEMGYDVEAKDLMRQWTAKVGTPSTYGFPALITRPFGMPADGVEAYGRKLVERIYESQFLSVAGFPLPSIPGLAMTPGLWAHVRREVEALSEGDGHHDDPRVVISAAIEARATSKASSHRLARTVTRAIVGIDEPRRSMREETGSIAPEEARDEVLEAMVLYEVLARSPRAQRRRSSRAAHL